jgi:hypothetical protein
MYKGTICYETVKRLLNREECIVIGFRNSMMPRIKSEQAVKCSPVTNDTILRKNDVVLSKVNGHLYLHKISTISGNQYQISNNHGHVNGWVSRKNIYGLVTSLLC